MLPICEWRLKKLLLDCLTFAKIFEMASKKLLFLSLLTFCFIPGAFAYLDPGSGSFIIQMIIASVAGVAYAMKLYWRKIMAFFKGTSIEVDPDEELNHD